jgi:hypothetical protein
MAKVYEITNDNKMILKLKFDTYHIKFRKECNYIKRLSQMYRKFRWHNQYNAMYAQFDDIDKRIQEVLSTHYVGGDKWLAIWLNALPDLLNKILQAKHDLQNQSWNWIDNIKF